MKMTQLVGALAAQNPAAIPTLSMLAPNSNTANRIEQELRTCIVDFEFACKEWGALLARYQKQPQDVATEVVLSLSGGRQGVAGFVAGKRFDEETAEATVVRERFGALLYGWDAAVGKLVALADAELQEYRGESWSRRTSGRRADAGRQRPPEGQRGQKPDTARSRKLDTGNYRQFEPGGAGLKPVTRNVLVGVFGVLVVLAVGLSLRGGSSEPGAMPRSTMAGSANKDSTIVLRAGTVLHRGAA